MIKYNDKTGVMSFFGKDKKEVLKYAKEHKLTFQDVVYLALMNGIAGGYFEKTKKLRNKA